jgi:hypothetical protein
MTADPFTSIPAERLQTWGTAVAAMEYAIRKQTRTAWRVAAQWWDELASMHSPTEGDREIYRKLAVQAWTQAADSKRTA